MQGVAHHAADQADGAVGREDAGGRIGIPGDLGTLDIVHGLHEIVDAERDRGHQDHAEELEPAEDVAEGRQGNRETDSLDGGEETGTADPAHVEAERLGAPGHHHPEQDGDEAGGNPAGITQAAEPGEEDDGEGDDTDDGCRDHLQGRTHGDEGDGDAGQGAEERGARRDPPDHGGDETADHQDEALDEDPGEPRLPGLQRIAGGELDRQHDHEDHDEHVRHADAGGQRADVVAPGRPGEPIGEPSVIGGGEAEHQPDGGQDAPEGDGVGHAQHEAEQAGEHQQVDEDVGAEAEERVPVSRHPERGPEAPVDAGCRRPRPACARRHGGDPSC
jgi:hypothetical protein